MHLLNDGEQRGDCRTIGRANAHVMKPNCPVRSDQDVSSELEDVPGNPAEAPAARE